MKKIIYLVICLNIVLALVQVVLSAKRATDGSELAKLNAEIAEAQLDNQRLRTNIYELSSLETIKQKAALLALSPVAIQYLNLELPVARAQ